MKLLRDMECLGCGGVLVDVWADCAEAWHCSRCDDIADFRTIVNGGLKTRYRLNDWPTDPEFYRGQVKALDVTAKNSAGEDVRKYTSGTREIGAPMHDNPKYHNGSEPRETRRDQLKHATRRKRGTLPIVCDLGAKPA